MLAQWRRFTNQAGVRLALLMAPLALLALAACTLEQAKVLEGILQNTDSVNGQVTIVTKDGKTVTLTIATEAPVKTEGTSTGTIEALEPGAQVRLETNEDGQVVRHIEARQAKVEGIITGVKGNEVTINTEQGRTVTVLLTDQSRIKLEDDIPGTLADLKVGAEAEAKFDPDSRQAFKISLEEEEAEVEGTIVKVAGQEVTIETERGRKLTLTVGDRTRIELDEDFPGAAADLREGVEIEAKFDPFTRRALKIKVEEEEEEAEIEGTIVGVAGKEVTIETERGRRLTLTVGDRTRIELDDDLPGTTADLRKGLEVEAKFDPATNVALEIEEKD